MANEYIAHTSPKLPSLLPFTLRPTFHLSGDLSDSQHLIGEVMLLATAIFRYVVGGTHCSGLFYIVCNLTSVRILHVPLNTHIPCCICASLDTLQSRPNSSADSLPIHPCSSVSSINPLNSIKSNGYNDRNSIMSGLRMLGKEIKPL